MCRAGVEDAGLLSKEYARQRYELIDWMKNNSDARPGDPYPFQGGENPFLDLLKMLGFESVTVSDGDKFAHQVLIE